MNTEITRKDVDDYIRKAVTGLSEGTDADGGYLLTRYIANEITGKAFYESIIAKRAKNYTWTNGGDGVKIPYSTSPLQNEPTTGIRAYWVSEAAEKTISKPQVGQADIAFGKLVIRVPITDELRADSSMVYDLIMSQAAGAIAYKLDRDMIFGTTQTIAGVLTGTNGTTATTYVTVPSAGGAMTSQILSTYIAKLHPDAYANAAWFVNAAVYQDIARLNNIVINWSDDGQLRAYGLPVIVAPQMLTFAAATTGGPGSPAPNDKLANINKSMILADFSKYCIVQREPKVKESKDFRFEYDESEIRIVLRIGGRMCANTMTLDDGVTYGYVVASTYNYA